MLADKKRDIKKVEAGHKPLGARGHAEKPDKNIANRTVAPGSPNPKPKKPNKKLNTLQRFLWAEGQQESGGNYLAVNADSGALGRWQVMPSNLPEWLRESGLPPMSPQEYLHDPKAQIRLATVILGGDYKRYGAAGAAAVWYSGRDDPTATYGDPPVYVYVGDVLSLMYGTKVGTVATTGTSTPSPWETPAVTRSDSWATQVRNSGNQFDKAAASAAKYGKYIRQQYG
jgi:Transglycosylase SLT domain